jgi:hypothetical protein
MQLQQAGLQWTPPSDLDNAYPPDTVPVESVSSPVITSDKSPEAPHFLTKEISEGMTLASEKGVSIAEKVGSSMTSSNDRLRSSRQMKTDKITRKNFLLI